MSRLLRITLLALVACLLLPALASAAERNFSLRYSNNVNGQIIFAANTMLQCPLGTPDPLQNTGCSGARAGTNARNNNSFDMGWIDIDGDQATFDSSSAQLLLPATGHVLFAGLYWTGVQKKGDTITGANGYKGVPLNAPNAAAIGNVKLQLPGATGYTPVTATQVDTAQIASGGGYTAFADITSLVNGAGAGTYTVADLQTGTGGNTDAGWTIVVAYADATEPLRNLSIFDGLKVVSATNFVDIPLSGFKTPNTGTVNTTVGVVAAEGDAGVSGDYLALDDQRLVDAVHPADNTENSTIANQGVNVTTKLPNYRNQLGYDASLFAANGYLANGATSAMFRAKTNGETYAPQAITFASELYSPNVTLTKTATPGQDFPGAAVTYTITATNNGSGDATNVQLRDPLPAGVTYAPGSVGSDVGNASYDATTNTVLARLGANASSTAGGTLGPGQSATVTYSVTIDGAVALGDTLQNVATLGFVSADLGLPITTVAEADIVVRYPDPGIDKTVTGSSGQNYTYNVVVTNYGSIGTTGMLTVDDTIGTGGTITGVSGTGWSCASATSFPCTTSNTLAAGATTPPLVVTTSYTGGSEVTNTATVSGGSEPTDPASPAKLNNEITAAAGTSPSAELSIAKVALGDVISFGENAEFQIQVYNNGPDTDTNVVVADTLPAGLDVQSVTATQGTCTATPSGAETAISCALGSMDKAYGAIISVTARVDNSLIGQTITNTATVTSALSLPAFDTAALTVRPAADLSIEKTAAPTIVDQAQGVGYTLTATNHGPSTAQDVQIIDQLPAAIDLTFPGGGFDASAGGTCTLTGATISCLWPGPTASGEVRSVSIEASTLASVPEADRDAVNTAIVLSNTDDPDPSNNRASATVRIAPAADLNADAGGPATIPAGGSGDLTFRVTNGGPSPATGTTMTITLPSGLTPTNAPASCTIAGQTVTCTIGTLANGATDSVVVTVQAAKGLVEADSVATVDVQSDVPDPVAENNTDIAPIVAGPVADLSVTKVASATTIDPGGLIKYTITVANAGGSSATGTTLTDELPDGLTITSLSASSQHRCSFSGRTVTCKPGEIVEDASFDVRIAARVGKDRAGAVLVNDATITPGNQKDPNHADNTGSATVKVTSTSDSKAKLAISGTTTPTWSWIHSTVQVSFTVTNTSDNPANSVAVCVTLPRGLSYVRSAGRKTGNKVCFSRSQLASQESATFTYTATGSMVGPWRARANASAGNASQVGAATNLGVLGPSGGVTG